MMIQSPNLGNAHIRTKKNKRKKISDAPSPSKYRSFTNKIEKTSETISVLYRFGKNDSQVVKRWQKWQQQFSELEKLFNHYPKQDPVYRRDVGIDWGLFLVYLLQWYFTDIILRTLMSSLPIYHLYNTRGLNSYIGLSLWEAFSGKAVPHPSIPNLIDIEMPAQSKYRVRREEDFVLQDKKKPFINPISGRRRLIGQLKPWSSAISGQPFGVNTSAGEEYSPAIYKVETLLWRYELFPLIFGSEKEKNKPRTFQAVTDLEFVELINRPFATTQQRKTGTID